MAHPHEAYLTSLDTILLADPTPVSRDLAFGVTLRDFCGSSHEAITNEISSCREYNGG